MVAPIVMQLMHVLEAEAQQHSAEVDVTYGGALVHDWFLWGAVRHDLALASASLFLVFLYTAAHLRSPALAAAALAQIVLTFPAAFAAYRACADDRELNVLHVLAFYIVLGVGVDDVYVYHNAFARAGPVPVARALAAAARRAGGAMCVTSVTSAAAFAANCVSQIPAVRRFGLLMALLVLANYACVMTVFPCAVAAWAARRAPWDPRPAQPPAAPPPATRVPGVEPVRPSLGTSPGAAVGDDRPGACDARALLLQARHALLLGLAGLTVAAALCAARLGVSQGLPSFFAPDHPVQKWLALRRDFADPAAAPAQLFGAAPGAGASQSVARPFMLPLKAGAIL